MKQIERKTTKLPSRGVFGLRKRVPAEVSSISDG
jgi:hypothetical protein